MLDAINLGGISGNNRANPVSTTSEDDTKTRQVEPRRPSGKLTEDRAVRALVDNALDHFSFDAPSFAMILSQYPAPVQMAFFDVCMGMLHTYSVWYESGMIGRDHPMFVQCEMAFMMTRAIS